MHDNSQISSKFHYKDQSCFTKENLSLVIIDFLDISRSISSQIEALENTLHGIDRRQILQEHEDQDLESSNSKDPPVSFSSSSKLTSNKFSKDPPLSKTRMLKLWLAENLGDKSFYTAIEYHPITGMPNFPEIGSKITIKAGTEYSFEVFLLKPSNVILSNPISLEQGPSPEIFAMHLEKLKRRLRPGEDRKATNTTTCTTGLTNKSNRTLQNIHSDRKIAVTSRHVIDVPDDNEINDLENIIRQEENLDFNNLEAFDWSDDIVL